jgi:hypothetical protein
MSKKMVMPFFDQQGPIFTNYVLLAITVNAAYIVLGIFKKRLKQKRVVMAAAGQWFVRWNNAPVHIATFLYKWPAKHNIQVLSHHCYLPNIAHADFVLFPKVKDHLDDITLTQNTLKSTWNGTGHQDSQHQRVRRRRLPLIVRAKQKVYAYRR